MNLRVVHVITGLARGGAETMLCKLLESTDRSRFESQVVSLKGLGPMAERLSALGVPVRALDMRPGPGVMLATLDLARWLARERPDVIQTWMYHADLLGGFAAKLAGGIPVAWGIRQSELDPRGTKRSHLLTRRLCARLSRRLAARIVCGSEAALRVHAALGYAADRMMVIPNGFPLDVFRPDPEARRAVRAEIGLADSTPLIGMVARFHPQKDHRIFLQAAALLRRALPQARFLLCGPGVDAANPDLRRWIQEAGVEDVCRLLGERQDVARIDAALDLATLSSSFGEGFPNVVGEAMACGVPCVVTDVGDSAEIVGDTGTVVPPANPEALAAAWGQMLQAAPETRRQRGCAARLRIEQRFSLESVVRRYENLYREIADSKPRALP